MRRREFITLIASAASACPFTAGAQQAGTIARIGFLGANSASDWASRLEAFQLGLRERCRALRASSLVRCRSAETRRDQFAIGRLEIGYALLHVGSLVCIIEKLLGLLLTLSPLLPCLSTLPPRFPFFLGTPAMFLFSRRSLWMFLFCCRFAMKGQRQRRPFSRLSECRAGSKDGYG
jgi:hypothetical protein